MPESLSPLFASTELAARVEGAEARLIADSTEAIVARGADQAITLPIAGGVASWAGPGSPLNKVAGVGFSGPLDGAELTQVERAFAERDTAVQIELSCLAEPSIPPMLSRRGYSLQGFENVLGRRLPMDGAPAVGELEIEQAKSSEIEVWIDTVVTGFAHPDVQGVPSSESFPREALQQVFQDMAGTPGLRSYLVRRQGEIAGGGSMRLFDGVVTLCGAATLPQHRRRGVQSGLLDLRLHEAAKAGCDLAVVTTQPGSKSQQNVQRKGFHLLYTRAVLVRKA